MRTHRHPDRDDGKHNHGKGEHLLGPLRPVAHGEQEAHDEKAEVEVVQDGIEVLCPCDVE